jgi:signal transduction histidine kinase
MSKLTDEELLNELRKRIEAKKNTIEELRLLNDELKVVNKKLEESESLKGHFISNITNEIINPFTSILGLSRTILAVKKEDWKRVISMVALIHSEAFMLDFQLKNIFVAAKIEAGEIALEVMNCDIRNLVSNVIESFRFEAKKKSLDFVYEFDCKPNNEDGTYSFKTDPDKIKMILINLLSNAVKFSLDENNILIKVWEEDKGLNFMVKDNGTGISAENQKIIFDRFKRLDTGINSLNRGHGLGLSISKALLDCLEGKIHIESEIGNGASFTVWIPESLTDIEGFASDANELMFESDEIF